nr:hypothetical protein [Tanacetum cinerariifolium]
MNLFKIGTSRKRSLGKDDASKQGRNLKQMSIFEESDSDVQAIMDTDYELAARLRDILKLKELIEICTKLSDRVLDLEKTKTAQAKVIANLKKKVKKLERKRRSRTPGMNLFKIGTSRKRSLGEDDASKQGRNLKQMSIFEESDSDVQAMMDTDYELAARLRVKEHRRKPAALTLAEQHQYYSNSSN